MLPPLFSYSWADVKQNQQQCPHFFFFSWNFWPKNLYKTPKSVCIADPLFKGDLFSFSKSSWRVVKKKKRRKDGVQNGDESHQAIIQTSWGTILGAQELASVSTNFQPN